MSMKIYKYTKYVDKVEIATILEKIKRSVVFFKGTVWFHLFINWLSAVFCVWKKKRRRSIAENQVWQCDILLCWIKKDVIMLYICTFMGGGRGALEQQESCFIKLHPEAKCQIPLCGIKDWLFAFTWIHRCTKTQHNFKAKGSPNAESEYYYSAHVKFSCIKPSHWKHPCKLKIICYCEWNRFNIWSKANHECHFPLNKNVIYI